MHGPTPFRALKRTIDNVATVFTYDGWNPIVEWTGTGAFAAYNIYGFRPDEILWRHSGGSNYYIYHARPDGSVTSLTDYWGNRVEKYTYDAFGQPTISNWDGKNERTASPYGNRFMFTGREYLATLGLYDYRNRFYHPGLGRFLQPDPIGFAAGDANLFRYCGGDPVNFVDPSGLDVEVSQTGPGNYVFNFPTNFVGNGSVFTQSVQGSFSGQFGAYNVISVVGGRSFGQPGNTVFVAAGAGRSVTYDGSHTVWYTGGLNPSTIATHESGHLAGLPDGYVMDRGVPRAINPYYINNPMGPNVRLGTTRFSDRDIATIITGSLPTTLPPLQTPNFGLRMGGGGGGENGISNGGSAPSNPFTNNSGYGFTNGNGDSVFGPNGVSYGWPDASGAIQSTVNCNSTTCANGRNPDGTPVKKPF